jgi:hypothetical protein
MRCNSAAGLPSQTKVNHEIHERHAIDDVVKSQKNPSPSRGEGRGEGDVKANTGCYNPLPLIPSRQGRGK